MDSLIKNRLFYDFYGKLLTKHQQDVLGLYYNEDMSLAEIADELGSTRQAIYDLVRRTSESLSKYENKLHLVAKEIQEEKKREELINRLKSVLDTETLSLNSKETIMDIIHNIEVERGL